MKHRKKKSREKNTQSLSYAYRGIILSRNIHAIGVLNRERQKYVKQIMTEIFFQI